MSCNNIFEQWSNFSQPLLREAEQHIIDDIVDFFEKNYEESDLPFNNIFGDKNRLAVSWTNNQSDVVIDNIKTELESKGYTIFHKTIFKQITKTVAGGNKQTRREPRAIFYAERDNRQAKLGKIIKKEFGVNSKEFKLISQKAEIYSIKPEEFTEAGDDSRYTFIITRHPIDVYRMSDHTGITSCHSSPDVGEGSYHYCAVQDAKAVGLLAYAVPTKMYKEFLKNGGSLDDNEIFRDSSRNIKGMAPTSRVRLRRFMHKETKTNVAVPETKVYGDHLTGLEDFISNWAAEVQESTIDKLGPLDEIKPSDFYRMGGVADSGDHKLFQYFFSNQIVYASATNDPNRDAYGAEELVDDYRANFNELSEEVDELVNQYNNKFDHISLYAEVNDTGDQLYITMSASMIIGINSFNTNLWEEFSLQEKAPVNADLRDIIEEAESAEIDIYSKEVHVSYNFDYYNDYAEDNAGIVANFGQELDNIDEDYKLYQYKVHKVLASYELIEQDNNFTRINELTNSFKNLDFDEPNNIYFLMAFPRPFGYADNIITFKKLYRKDFDEAATELAVPFWKKLLSTSFASSSQLKLPLKESELISIDDDIAFMVRASGYRKVLYDFYISLSTENIQPIIRFFKYLDENIEEIVSALNKVIFGKVYNYLAREMGKEVAESLKPQFVLL